MAARRLAAEAVRRIDDEGAYANLLVPSLLDGSGLAERDRAFVTELAYGTTRRRRACDWLVDRYLVSPPDPSGRALLRIGAYQLVFLHTPPHAAVSATVAASPKRLRGLVNAVLRRVADGGEPTWPDEATRLSYPDWVLDRLTDDLGAADASAALAAMDEVVAPTTRADGYVQDRASQWVAEAVGAGPGDLVVDLCAAPGGKATFLAGRGARVVAGDLRPSRVGLIAANARTLGQAHPSTDGADHVGPEVDDEVGVIDAGGADEPDADGPGRVWPLVADGTAPAVRGGVVDRVLVDAPCSGLGALGRRADARWRVQPDDVGRLAELQRRLVTAALDLVGPGGTVVYSVCTLTAAETVAIDRWVEAERPEVVAEPLPADRPWRPLGRGGLVLPHDAGTDGMYALRLRVPGPSTGATPDAP